MKSEQIAQEIRLSEWAKDIKECRASGMTVKDWCASKGSSITPVDIEAVLRIWEVSTSSSA